MSQIPTYDLTNCDREPIHIPGCIQAHGALIACDGKEFVIGHASENFDRVTGVPARDMLGRSLLDFVDPARREEMTRALAETGRERANQIRFYGLNAPPRDALVHRMNDSLILEFELDADVDAFGQSVYQILRATVSRLRASSNLEQLFQACVEEIKRLTGFDRVIIYKFDRAWNGNVLAEAKGERGDSYLNLHFPASDIPRQARDLYLRNSIRNIADVSEPQVAVIGESDRPLDLSLAGLRGVSPIHLEYLQNMEATASMSISLVKSEGLWGLISCTHLSGPRRISFAMRSVCEIIGEVVSSLLSLRASAGHDAEVEHKLEIQAKLLDAMAKHDDFAVGLLSNPKLFLELTGASGGAVYSEGNFRVVGQAPDPAQLKKIVAWMAEQTVEDVLVSDEIPDELSLSQSARDDAAGVLGFSISRAQATYVMWVRPEVVQTVTWGGNPRKALSEVKGLHPRKSFEAWKQTVRNRCLPWRHAEVEAARRLRTSIMNVVLHRLEKISLLNRELRRSNGELDSFAHAASHDLKEPLRGIHNYAMILSRSLEGRIDEAEKGRFATIGRLSQRMEELINSLLNFAQVGRAEMAFAENDLNTIVKTALDSLQTKIDEEHVTVDCDFNLPTVNCDRVQIVEIFTNLINNAIKYSDAKAKHVKIEARPGEHGEAVLSVSDNGIGIEPDHHATIFKIFKRLHAKDRYGGGTGTGLTIAAKIVERHGGRIWVDSAAGGGSKFSFSLPDHGRGR